MCNLRALFSFSLWTCMPYTYNKFKYCLLLTSISQGKNYIGNMSPLVKDQYTVIEQSGNRVTYTSIEHL